MAVMSIKLTPCQFCQPFWIAKARHAFHFTWKNLEARCRTASCVRLFRTSRALPWNMRFLKRILSTVYCTDWLYCTFIPPLLWLWLWPSLSNGFVTSNELNLWCCPDSHPGAGYGVHVWGHYQTAQQGWAEVYGARHMLCECLKSLSHVWDFSHGTSRIEKMMNGWLDYGYDYSDYNYNFNFTLLYFVRK